MNKIIKDCTSPRLISTGTLDQLDGLYHIGEGMLVCKFRNTNTINAVIALLGCYYLLNACFSERNNGRCKNVYLFLEHLLTSNQTNFPILQLQILQQD